MFEKFMFLTMTSAIFRYEPFSYRVALSLIMEFTMKMGHPMKRLFMSGKCNPLFENINFLSLKLDVTRIQRFLGPTD